LKIGIIIEIVDSGKDKCLLPATVPGDIAIEVPTTVKLMHLKLTGAEYYSF
jgi:hypothetical protein